MLADRIRYEAAERVAMRRWLRSKGIEPFEGASEAITKKALMAQVCEAGGDPAKLMAEGRAHVDQALEREHEKQRH